MIPANYFVGALSILI